MNIFQRIKAFETNVAMILEHSVNIRKSLDEIRRLLEVSTKVSNFVAPTAPITIELDAAKNIVDEASNILDNSKANK